MRTFSRGGVGGSGGIDKGFQNIGNSAQTAAKDMKSFNSEARNTDRSLGSLGKSGIVASKGLSGVAGSMRDVKTVAKGAIGIPAVIAALGAVPAVATAAAGATAQLGLALGQAGAGFALIGGAATAGAVGGLKAYSSAIMKAATDTRDAWVSSNEKAAEALEKQRTAILTASSASKEFNTQINSTIIQLTKTEAAIGKASFPTITREMGAWTGILRQLTPAIANTAGAITDIAGGFSRFVRTAEGGRALQRTFEFVNSSTIKAATAIDHLGRAGFRAFQLLIPGASRLQNSIVGVARSIDQWTSKSRNMNQLAGVFRTLETRMNQTITVAKNFGQGIIGVFSALNAQGGPDRLMKGLVGLSGAFQQTMSASGRGRQAIIQFMNAAQPALNSMGGLAKEAAVQFLALANNVVKAGQRSGGIGTLATVINSVANSLKPIRLLLQETFIAMGPVLADLLPDLAKLAQTFLGSTGVLVRYLRSVDSILEAFNSLPPGVRRTVAEIVAFNAAMKLTTGQSIPSLVGGLGSVVTSVGIMAGQWRIMSALTKQTPGHFRGVAAGARGLGAAFTALKIATVAGQLAILHTALGALGGAIGRANPPAGKLAASLNNVRSVGLVRSHQHSGKGQSGVCCSGAASWWSSSFAGKSGPEFKADGAAGIPEFQRDK
jgi:hypothetical protein